MRNAILIINHISARQTKRLIERLNNGYFDFYLQVDKKTDIKPYLELQAIPNVYFIKNRISALPGGYSTLKATLAGLKQIVETDTEYLSVTLLHGAEYPTKSTEDICDFLNINKGKQFIAFNDNWSGNIPEKIGSYHLTDYNIPVKTFAEGFILRVFGKPETPRYINFIGQSPYWTITPNCARYVLAYLERMEMDSFLKFTKDSAAFIFQSVIMTSAFRDDVVNNNYRYTGNQADSKTPKPLTAKDFNKIIFADSLFAGHFDINVDEEIFDMIDRANAIKISYRAARQL